MQQLNKQNHQLKKNVRLRDKFWSRKRLIKEWTAWDIARRAAFAFFGIFSGTEENPEFIQSVESKIAKDANIIVACSAGGTTRPSQNLPEGQQPMF